MRLFHHTNIIPKTIHVKKQISNGIKPKPEGFWLSDDNEEENWPNYCLQEYTVKKIPYCLEYELCTDEILHLKTELELINFTKLYKIECERFNIQRINWLLVSQKYKGILITPYIHSCRMNIQTEWYYGWDVASACVWEPNCLKLINTTESLPNGEEYEYQSNKRKSS